MFFSKALLVAIFLGAISVLATPHAHQHPALHRRVVAARVAFDQNAPVRDAPSNATISRQNSDRCSPRSSQASSIILSSASTTQQAPTVTSSAPPDTPAPSSTPADQQPSSVSHAPSSTSVDQQPSSVTPTPSPQLISPTTTSTAPAAAGTGGPFSGQGTYFQTGLGACGITNVETDFICAVSEIFFDAFPGYNGVNPNTNPVCNKKIQVNYQGNSVTLIITDRCEACKVHDIDMTSNAFQQLAPLSVGRISDISWSFV